MPRQVDAIYLEEIRRRPARRDLAGVLGAPADSFGGCQAHYDQAVALRAVTSRDRMTADWFPFPPDVLGHISTS
jgi:GMP synthase (glutamine-hydrolysing)